MEHCKHPTPRKKLDNAILRYISTSEQNTTESDIASASNTAAKDECIREKERIGVEAFDVTMVASMSDAVDTSLKKWRVALQELSSLATDTEFGVNHPIYTATLQKRQQSSYTRQTSTPSLHRQTESS
jgi:hypothetical protein